MNHGRKNASRKTNLTRIGSLRIRNIERKIRKPAVRPGQRFADKTAYRRSVKKQEDKRLSEDA